MNASTRLAALPELPAATRNRPWSFFSRQLARKAARSIVRMRSRIPIAARSLSAPSATRRPGGGGGDGPVPLLPAPARGEAGALQRAHAEPDPDRREVVERRLGDRREGR